ncbi:MAG: hypothetical protein IJ298_09925 [Ruminococcus sp.]|nr:hypothetical protein [Ruminococcus sp.]
MRKRLVSFIMCVLMMVSSAVIGTTGVSAAAARGPIKGNGTNGIYIDILGYPYTNYATIPDYGQAAYSEVGCAWFASARAKQLTGKGYTIYSGYNWYNTTYAVFGFSRGSEPRAKALACFANHVSVIERVDGDTLTISEGGVQGTENAQYGHCQIITKNRYTFEAGNSGTGAFLGYVYLGVAVGSEPLTNPDITTDKSSYIAGDTVNVSWVASSANSNLSHYWISVTDPTGAQIISERVNNATNYSFVASQNGNYTIYVSATPVGSQAGEGSLTTNTTITVAQPAGKPVMAVLGGTSVENTVFSWNTPENTAIYNLLIKKKDGTFSCFYEIKITENSFAQVLSAGEYTAVLTAFSPTGSETESDEVSFTVKPQSGSDAGWTYSDKLPADYSSGKYELERKYTYETTSAEDLGNGWVKGDFDETKYVNSGEAYWSNIELPTSDTRVLLNYIYYHYCGSSGNSANFTATSSYPHYDWLSKEGVYEYSVNTDYDDARYKFYHLKWSTGADVYCSSGATCDGSFGTHGYRSYYWYKSCQYQDKIAKDYYSYSVTTDWTTAIETGASQVTYRYRLKDTSGMILGDADLDGAVNIKDATLIQKYLAKLAQFDESAKLCADAEADGTVNIKDATAIQKFAAGLLPSDTKVGKNI